MNREGSNTPSGCLYHTPAKYETKLVLQFGMEGVKAIGFPWLQFGIEGVEAIGWLDAWFQHQLGSTDVDSDWMPALAIGPGWTDAKEAPEPGSRDAEVFRVSAVRPSYCTGGSSGYLRGGRNWYAHNATIWSAKHRLYLIRIYVMLPAKQSWLAWTQPG